MSMRVSSGRIMMVGVALGALLCATAGDAQVFTYPQQGQSPQQQQRDQAECHVWAVQQSGFDPARASAAPPPPPPPSGPQGRVLRGATRGAALGAVGGAIAGDAGKGAAAGAAMGGLFGGMRHVDQQRAQQEQYSQAQAQQQATQAQGADMYNRALAACLGGRGYTVR